MYYTLTDGFALRTFLSGDHYLYHRSRPKPMQINNESFDVLVRCDGKHDLEENEIVKQLSDWKVIRKDLTGGAVSEWSEHKKIDNRFVPSMNLMITGKCNFNCLHCYNAAENEARMEEWDIEDIEKLLDEASECGIHSVTLTGGEPMLHPGFNDIVREIRKRNMVLERIATNGSLLTRDTLLMFRELEAFPQIKISFDGVGHHDHMRGRKGAEEKTLSAFRLCRDEGFETMAQTQVFRANLGSMKETVCQLEDAGAGCIRLIRTTPTQRWINNSPEGSLSVEEYFNGMLELAKWYMGTPHETDLIIWRFMVLSSRCGDYHLTNVIQKDGVYHPGVPLCLGNRLMIAITCEGEVFPCLQMSGTLSEYGFHYDSLKERSLSDILKSGSWLETVCRNRSWLHEESRECGGCPWFKYCAGGCRALGILDSLHMTGSLDYSSNDPLACHFFKNGWLERTREELKEYTEV